LPVKVAILNNQFLGMVRQWQDMFYGKRYSSSCLADNPDFAKVAEAFGATGIKVTKKRDVRPAIDKAIETPGPVVLDFAVDREENVMPMVPAGAAISEMIMEA
jgi:acetolactate synthase-1/2/3 large subunit